SITCPTVLLVVAVLPLKVSRFISTRFPTMSLPALSPNDMNDVPLYDQVASRVGSLIRQGTFGAGDRLPSVRHLSREWKISITTVMAAYRQLETSGLVEARPQSGYYVIARGPSVVAPRREPPSDPQPVTLNTVMRRI